MVKCDEALAPPRPPPPASAAALAAAIASKRANGVNDEDAIVPRNGIATPAFFDADAGVSGFRLRDADSAGDAAERDSATSASVYSFYKQRIDAMFDETRSQMSGLPGRRASDHALYHRLETEEEQRQRRINNSVQARIESMFAEVATSPGGGGADGGGKGRAPRIKTGGASRFPVDYLGSVALGDRVTSLQGLQEPLSDLYFAYCRLRAQHAHHNHHQPQLLPRVGGGRRFGPTAPPPHDGTLEISSCGLKVQHSGGPDQSALEQLNPFPTIAVWAAVKFVSRRRADGGGSGLEYAFLPLIADPDAIDKGTLFRPLGAGEARAVSAVDTASAADIDPAYSHHSPLFAVVMRKHGVSRQLECHGFVCACSEDAVVIAAKLYQALMGFMQARGHHRNKGEKAPAANGGAVSIAGDSPSAHAAAAVRPLSPSKGAGARARNGYGSNSVAGDLQELRSVADSVAGRMNGHVPPIPRLSTNGMNGTSGMNGMNGKIGMNGLNGVNGKNGMNGKNGKKGPAPAVPPPPPPHKQRDSPEPRDTIPLPKRSPSIKMAPPVPQRPPRRKTKSSASSASDDGEEPIVIQKGSKSNFDSSRSRIRHSRSESEPCTGTVGAAMAGGSSPGGTGGQLGVRRTVSDLHGYAQFAESAESTGTTKAGGGDILTKVAIPRSKSFLNAGGPLTRYGPRRTAGPGYGPHPAGHNGSPLGFKELFAEFRVQEGLTSMDDILNAIIDAEGMSFNDLKPIYKEFLLKLAVTLTKDELYQRSKSIMRRQRKRRAANRRSKPKGGKSCVARKKSFTAGGGLKRVFRRSVNKLKQSKPRPQSFEFTSVLFPSSVPLRASKKLREHGFCLESTTTSTSSYSARNFTPQRASAVASAAASSHGSKGPALRLPRRTSSKRGGSGGASTRAPVRKRSQRAHSASEDSDFFSMVRAGKTTSAAPSGPSSRRGGRDTTPGATLAQNRSSSGYFSCSECSYDSESCTCTSADKCYCSMGEGAVKSRKSKKSVSREAVAPGDETAPTCGCDTDSCMESDKCYCTLKEHHHHAKQKVHRTGGSVIDQLKQRGFAVSESSVSRAASPWRRQEQQRRRSGPAAPPSMRLAKSLNALEAAAAASGGGSSRGRGALPNRRTRSDESGASGGAYNRRMDVYDRTPTQYGPVDETPTRPQSSRARRSYSSDNLIVDYDLFTTSSRSDEEAVPGAASPEGRVLVVSARDPRGRIIYMGASCRGEPGGGGGGARRARLPASLSAATSTEHRRRRRGTVTASTACEALSVKKSAEIAAVFSDMKSAQVLDDKTILPPGLPNGETTGEVYYNTLEPTDYYFAGRSATKSYLGSSLENSLGYLP